MKKTVRRGARQKALPPILCLLMITVFVLTACGRTAPEPTKEPAPTGAETEAPAPAPTDVPETEAPEEPSTAAPTQPAADTPALVDCAIEHETEFGGVYIKAAIDEFNALGFAYGDSVDVVFSNGYRLEDLPYYNGYYVETGKPLLVAYPGYPYIKAGINNGEDLWDEAGLLGIEQRERLWVNAALAEKDTATITMHERGKYADIQDARDIHYYDDRARYPSDVVFANFRAVQAGRLAEGALCRSASPCDNQHNRAPYVDALIREAGVNAVLDLADTPEKIAGYMAKDDFASPYFKTLQESGRVFPLALNTNFGSEEFRAKAAAGLTAISEQAAPYLVHCTEGKDRTGFICVLIEALAGASYDEIVDDYMLTYDHYYGINEVSDKRRYDLILEGNLIPMFGILTGQETGDPRQADLEAGARAYLKSGGMTDAQIDAFLARITK